MGAAGSAADATLSGSSAPFVGFKGLDCECCATGRTNMFSVLWRVDCSRCDVDLENGYRAVNPAGQPASMGRNTSTITFG
jgi:hypothetical protein